MKGFIRAVVGLTIILLTLAAGGVFLLAAPLPGAPSQIQGVSFSAPHASGIGLNWQQTYIAVLDDLGVRRLRLSAYWDVTEPQKDMFSFADLDFQMDEAASRGAHVILGVGRKLPRWPECHDPQWAAELTEQAKQQEVLELVEATVERYKGHPALAMWQLENEPLLKFGICPPQDRQFLMQEEVLVRSLDPDHPILMTDSGELNWWLDASSFGDVLGTTMYRTVFSEKTLKQFSYDYIFPSWLYRLKSRYVRLLRGNEVLISELQGEPWGSQPFPQMSAQEREQSFSPERFLDNWDFAQRTQLPSAYWWGVEYWYWEKEINGDGRYWEIAKEVFARNNKKNN
ncbi:MAG: beta-galactosidase [Candidatus Andersenbacteria bacterium]|nr:beta-galactosidase [Candidatus Andersenbacteria bacterium]MBI3251157.1 beta-galactosidase [Candidatus Andersenbacteria bacterium]